MLEKRKKRLDGFVLRWWHCNKERSIRDGSCFAEHRRIALPALQMIIAHRHGVRRQNVPAVLEEFMFIRGGNHFFDIIKM